MPGIPSITPVQKHEIPFMRWMFFISWIVIFGVLPLLLIQGPVSQKQAWGYTMNCAFWLIFGWFVGYRRLIGPTGMVIPNKK